MAEFAEHTAVEQIVPLTAPVPEIPAERLPEAPPVTDDALRVGAVALAAEWRPATGKVVRDSLPGRLKQLKARLAERLRAARAIATKETLTPQLELLESTRALEGVLQTLGAAAEDMQRVPHVELANGQTIPRVMNIGEGYLATAKGIWSAASLSVYVRAVQVHETLLLAEVLLLPAALKLAQLEFILDRADEAFAAGPMPAIEQSPFSAPLHSLRRLNQFEWQDVLEPLVPFQAILAGDPAGVFLRMEEENRDSYRKRRGRAGGARGRE